MAKFPIFSASSRIQTGAPAAQMSPVTIGRPTPLSTGILQSRSVNAPFYQTRIDEVGPLIRNKAINQFGEVLADVAISLADRRARLDAEEKTQEFYSKLKPLEIDYYQLEGKQAVDGYNKFAATLDKLEEETLAGASNHTKIYLTRSLRNLKNSSFDTASRFVAAQYRVANQRAIDQQVARTSDRLKDFVYETDPKKTKEFIETAIDEIGFLTEDARQSAKDTLYSQLFKYQVDSVVVPGEEVSDSTLLNRIVALKDRMEVYKSEISLKQYVAFNSAYMQASVNVANQIENQEIARKKANDEFSKSMINEIYKDLNDNKPFPETKVKSAATFGVITEKNYNTLKKLFVQRDKGDGTGKGKRTVAQTLLFLDYVARVTADENFESINADLLRDAELKNLSGEDAVTISKMASTAYGSYYSKMFKQGFDEGDVLIMTTGTLATIRKPEDTAVFSDYIRDLRTGLTELHESGQLNSKTGNELITSLKEKYSIRVQLKNLPNIDVPDVSLQRPKTAAEVLRAGQMVESLNIPPEEKQLRRSRVMQYQILIDKMNAIEK